MKKKTTSQKITKKDLKKIFRGFLQAAFLVGSLYMVIRALYSFSSYPKKQQSSEQNCGFVALSYFGVAMESDDNIIGVKQLEEQFAALKRSGYVTITQQDIIGYYEQGKPLPEHALFLMFEDGRRDTGIFAQKLLEEYNYIGTMFSYADKFEERDSKFLTSKDMKKLEESTFWELGTNGYRLAYINVFDKEQNFIGDLTAQEYVEQVATLGRDYDHYLMDYRRDAYDIPIESYDEMKRRIEEDYVAMNKVYTEELGKLPIAYALMHANTNQFGTNDNVSRVNEEKIYELFKMNFNREGYSFNQAEDSIYDLTRMQPQSYWSTNHLLMRLWDDTKQEVAFVSGDESEKAKWQMYTGESEFKEEEIILTSEPSARGFMALKKSETFKDVDVTVRLKGNKAGAQSLYLRADDDLTRGIQVELKENNLNLYELEAGKPQLIQSVDLERLEDERKVIGMIVSEEGKEEVEPVQEIQLKDIGNRFIHITLKEDLIDIEVDEKHAIQSQKISCNDSGGVYLSAEPLEAIYSQRNLTDDVYDARFEQLVIAKASDIEEENILYEHRLSGIDKVIYDMKQMLAKITNWFIDTL